ncbi:MAG TPA: hypothetical protein V6D15_08755 [Oculatellaceae cyanobacterium]
MSCFNSLGIGREEATHQGLRREWLYWYDRQGQRYLTPEELAKQEQQLRIQAEERANKLAERLRSLGIDPDFLS